MKIFLAGYYGFKNLGDEILLYKIIQDISKKFFQANFFIWTGNKEFTKNFFSSFPINTVDRFSLEETISSIKDCDIVVSGGGGLIQEYYGIKIENLFKDFGYHVPSYAIPPFLGKIFGKKVFYWALGHGPVFSEEGKIFSRWFYSLADIITVRDKYSYFAIKELCPEAKLFLDIDPLLDMDFLKFKVLEKKDSVLGVSLRKWFIEEDIFKKVKDVLIRLLREKENLKILLIPCDLKEDLEITSALKEALASKNVLEAKVKDPFEVVSAISSCSWFLGMRLHSLIVAYKLGIPVLSLSYDIKTAEFCEEVGLDYLKVTDFSEGELYFKLKNLIENSKILKIKDFSYKTPKIFEEFFKNNPLEVTHFDRKETEKKLILDKEKMYVEDFVKILVYQKEHLEKRLKKSLDQVAELEREREVLSEKVAELEREKQNLISERDNLAFRLSEIYNSNFWKLASKYYKLRDTTFLRKIYPYYKPILDWIFKKKPLSPYFLQEAYQDRFKVLQEFIDKYKKLLIIISTIPFNETYNQRPLNFSREFSHLGYGVIFLVWQWSREDLIPQAYEQVFLNIIQIPIYEFLESLNILNFNNNEKIFCITFPEEKFIYALRILRSKGFKIVYDIMDDWEGFYEVGQASWFKKKNEERTILEADLVCAINEYLIKKFEFLRKDIVLIPNGYSLDFVGENTKFIAGKEVESDRITLGYVGWLSEGRFNWEFLFEILKKYPDLKIELIGYGLCEEIKNKLAEFNNIKYLGTIHPLKLKDYVIKWNGALILFKDKKISYGADPLKLYQYLYYGLPVITTGLPHLANYPLVYNVKTVEEFEEVLKKIDSKDKIEILRREKEAELEELLRKALWSERIKLLLEKLPNKTFWE